MLATRPAYSPLKAVAPLCVIATLLTGCATAHDLSGLERPGYQGDGTYVLSAREQELDCRQLQKRSQGLEAQMLELSQRAVHEMQQVPATVANAWGRMFGDPGQGVPSVAEYNEARAETAALNATLASKGCTSSVNTATINRR
jgi:hypothetical protein